MTWEGLEKGTKFDKVSFPRIDRLPRNDLFLPSGVVGTSPVYWRWSADLAGYVDVSFIVLDDAGQTSERVLAIPAFAGTVERAEQLAIGDTGLTAEEWNSIGFSASFAWRIKSVPEWQNVYPSVDLDLARRCFERAAELGHWAALNNLAVIYRDGLGVPVDAKKAFQLLTRAAQSLDPTALRNLADLYERGIGVAADLEHARYLRELAETAK